MQPTSRAYLWREAGQVARTPRQPTGACTCKNWWVVLERRWPPASGVVCANLRCAAGTPAVAVSLAAGPLPRTRAGAKYEKHPRTRAKIIPLCSDPGVTGYRCSNGALPMRRFRALPAGAEKVKSSNRARAAQRTPAEGALPHFRGTRQAAGPQGPKQKSGRPATRQQ
jgi:hypothetical protein